MTPTRLIFIVEGQTEQAFVQQILCPYLSMRRIYATAECPQTGTGGRKQYRGGVSKYFKLRRHIERRLRQDRGQSTRFTTMLDLYGLPADFPTPKQATRSRTAFERVHYLEKAFADDIGDHRFIPYIQLHEFEALVLADALKLESHFPSSGQAIRRLADMASKFESPEVIDDCPDGAPSKRIIAELPEYANRKVTVGPLVAQEIGLDALRRRCSHFDEWIRTLEALGAEELLADATESSTR